MTTERQAGTHSQRWTRDRLVGLGLAEAHVLLAHLHTPVRQTEADLQPTSYDATYAPLVQRVARLMDSGRNLSIFVCGGRDEAQGRRQTALQLALGLLPHGRQVVLVDADFLQPGLGGLITDTLSEGLIDMVRFGRSSRSLLLRPVPEGPWLLPAGSFPSEDPAPLDLEALRSVAYRVTQACDLALYIGPLPVRNETNPLVKVCDHVVYATLEDGHGQDVADAIAGLQQQSVHVAGVVLYASETTQVELGKPFAPGSLFEDPGSPVIPWTAEPEPPPPAPEPPAPARQWKQSPASLPEPRFEPPPPEPRFEPPSWSVSEAPSEEAVAGASYDLASRSEESAPLSGDAHAVERPLEESLKVRRELGLPDADFAFDDAGRDSKWPLVAIVTLIVLILGFIGWALWTRRGSEPVVQKPETTDVATPGPGGTATPDAGAPPLVTTPPSAGSGAPGEASTLDDRAAERVETATPEPVTLPPPSKPAVDPAAEPPVQAPPQSAVEPAAKPPEKPPVQTPPPAAVETPTRPAVTPPDGEFAVHVASYKTIEQAYKDIGNLQKLGYEGRAVKTDLGSKGIWYRVYVGSYPTAADAARVREALLKHPDYTFAQVRRLPRE